MKNIENKLDLGVKVGTAVFIFNKNKQFLLGKRKNSITGNGSWCLPGGRMERWEKPEDTTIREVKEETDLEVSDLEFLTFSNDMFRGENEHWLTLFYVAKNWRGTLSIKEIDKCEEWKWFDINNLPDNLFLSLQNVLNLNLNLFSLKEPKI